MDGDRRECPIVSNEIVRLRYGDEEDEVLQIAPTHDVIMAFPDPKYNYLRYYRGEDRELVAIFLAENVLADLLDSGIPMCIRNSITDSEAEAYESHLGHIAADFIEVEEVDEYDPGTPPPVPLELMPGDPIDAEVQKAHEEIEHGGLEWFLGEWEAGRDGAA